MHLEIKNDLIADLEESVYYSLYAIVIHAGRSATSGHYYTIGKDFINGKGWKIFNDSSVTEVSEDFILQIADKMKVDTPY